MSSPPRNLIIALASVAFLGAATLLLATPWGLGLSPDSAIYIGAARSLLLGAGFSLPSQSGGFVPVVHYPPLYPTLLGAIGLAGVDPLPASRWLNALLFATNVCLMGCLAFAGTKSISLSLCACALLVTGFPIFQAHSMAWSEPLFVCFELGWALFLIAYLRNGNYRILMASAAMAGLSALTRYAGATCIASGVLSILLPSAVRKKRLLDAGIFLAISSLPILLWMARNWTVAGTIANRNVSFHPIGLEYFVHLMITLVSWVSIAPVSYVDESVSLSISLLAVGLLLVFFWTHRRVSRVALIAESVAFPRVMLSFILVYLLLLFATISFLDHQTPIDSRTLAPIYIPIVLAVLAFGVRLRGQWGAATLVTLVLPVVIVVVGLQLASTWPWVTLTYERGIGYSSPEWRDSDLIKKVASQPIAKPVFSNAPDVLYTLLGRPADMLPRKTNPDTRQPNETYDLQMRAMMDQLKARQGLLVYFDRIQWRWYLPSADELEAHMGLRLLVREKDGSIYQID